MDRDTVDVTPVQQRRQRKAVAWEAVTDSMVKVRLSWDSPAHPLAYIAYYTFAEMATKVRKAIETTVGNKIARPPMAKGFMPPY